jgi:2-dehydropantoate 2-reductase
LVGATTALLTLQNGLGNEEQLADLFGPERVLGGLCFVCLNRVAPGVVQHTAHGNVLLGELRRPPEPRTHSFADLFRRGGVRCDVVESLDRAHWEKLVWNIPFNGLGVAAVTGYEALIAGRLNQKTQAYGPCLTTDQLLDDPRWNHLVRELMFEVITTARALGFQLPDSLVDDRIARTREMGAYKASTLLDFERGQEIELESLFQKPLHHARAAGVPVPRLGALCQILSQLAPPVRTQG